MPLCLSSPLLAPHLFRRFLRCFAYCGYSPFRHLYPHPVLACFKCDFLFVDMDDFAQDAAYCRDCVPHCERAAHFSELLFLFAFRPDHKKIKDGDHRHDHYYHSWVHCFPSSYFNSVPLYLFYKKKASKNEMECVDILSTRPVTAARQITRRLRTAPSLLKRARSAS